jgi:hypothetical protein
VQGFAPLRFALVVLGLMAQLPAVHAQAPAASAPDRRNWFGDPFFQASDRVKGCPEPAGARLTEAERKVQSHGRAERGTTCWLAGKCERPNSYAYDRDIAQKVREAFAAKPPVPVSSLWITVQRRIVYLEGCVGHERDEATLEAWVRTTAPEVERAVAIVHVKGRRKPPYKLLSAP